jgi:hypothetical protein
MSEIMDLVTCEVLSRVFFVPNFLKKEILS